MFLWFIPSVWMCRRKLYSCLRLRPEDPLFSLLPGDPYSALFTLADMYKCWPENVLCTRKGFAEFVYLLSTHLYPGLAFFWNKLPKVIVRWPCSPWINKHKPAKQADRRWAWSWISLISLKIYAVGKKKTTNCKYLKWHVRISTSVKIVMLQRIHSYQDNALNPATTSKQFKRSYSHLPATLLLLVPIKLQYTIVLMHSSCCFWEKICRILSPT